MLAAPQLVTVLTAGEDGEAQFDFEAQSCGMALMQALDTSSCEPSEVSGY